MPASKDDAGVDDVCVPGDFRLGTILPGMKSVYTRACSFCISSSCVHRGPCCQYDSEGITQSCLTSLIRPIKSGSLITLI